MLVTHLHLVSIYCHSDELQLLFISRSRIYEPMVYLYRFLILMMRVSGGFLGSSSSSTGRIVNVVVNLFFELMGC